MSFKKVAYDAIALDQGQIVEDSKCCLKVNAVISRAGVYQYEDGKAFKCKPELLKATRTAQYAKLTVGNHPPSQIIQSQSHIHGGVEKPFFDNGKIRAVLSFDKHELSEDTINKIRDAIDKKTGLDNSIGFYYTPEWTPGIDRDVNTDKEERYDYIMRDIVIDHVAVITEPNVQGRCTFPKCGVGADCVKCPRKIGKTFSSLSYPETIQVNDKTYALVQTDVIEKRGNQWCVMHCHGPEAGTPIKCFATREEAEAMHRAIEANSSVQTDGGKKELTEKKQDYGASKTTYDELQALFKKCVAEKVAEGLPRDQAEARCLPATKYSDEPTPNDKTAAETKKDYAEPTNVEGERTPLVKCVAMKVEQGSTPDEAQKWCEAELAGEHETVDSLQRRINEMLELKRQRDIETKAKKR